MKPIWKYCIASVCVLLVVVYGVVSLHISRRMMPQPKCAHLIVNVQDESERQLVDAGELRDVVIAQGLNPIGKTSDQIALLAIEQAVQNHEMVREAQCYRTMAGDVVVNVQQRIPLFHVLTEYETYYIDTDCKMMPPAPEIDVPFMVIGHVSHRMAQDELYKFALWLREHPYWGETITGIDVISPKCIELTEQRHNPRIILGSWQDFDRKLNKLQRFYEAEKNVDIEQYSQMDLRYHGQVIGLKNE